MYYLIRNNYCIKISEDKNELIKKYTDGDTIQNNDSNLKSEDIFTISSDGELIKK